MRVPSVFVLMGILLALIGCGKIEPTAPATHSDLNPGPVALTLDGTYHLHKSSAFGTWLYSGAKQDFEVVIEGETMRYTGKSWRNSEKPTTLRTDPSKNPATIDLIDDSKIQRGIYKLDGGELIIATAPEGKEERPQDFTPSDKVTICVYKRK